ncbi:MAG TPA: polysaccharide deacetylase family protein, partial [Terriglobales bacterium]|nr:polysaccharide deacetylase family protein [Terriglobales bacterium]
DELTYPAAGFAALCRYWRDHYEILSLDCLLARLAHSDEAPHPCLTITFDDGYADNAEVAAPILDRLNLSATFFVTTAVIGTRARFAWDAGLPATPPLMSWAQVRELRAAGFGIGSHTATHARLAGLRGAELHYELVASRQRLQMELGEPVLDFAYPFGGPHDCDAPAREAVRRAGYRCCLACHGGGVAATDSPYRLRRISVSPRHHANPQAWARTYTRLRWGAARSEGRGHG